MFKSKEQIILEEIGNGTHPFDICKKYNFTTGSVYYFLYKNNINTNFGKRDETKNKYSARMKKRHSGGESSGVHHWSYGKMKLRGNFVDEFEVLDELKYYIDQDLTLKEMSELMDIDSKSVTNRLRKFGLQQGIRSGNRHPDWKGGHSKYRGKDWYIQRQKALHRDSYTCQNCNVTRQNLENPRYMHVHHIIPYEISKDNSLSNLITLCVSCHNKREHLDGRHSFI